HDSEVFALRDWVDPHVERSGDPNAMLGLLIVAVNLLILIDEGIVVAIGRSHDELPRWDQFQLHPNRVDDLVLNQVRRHGCNLNQPGPGQDSRQIVLFTTAEVFFTKKNGVGAKTPGPPLGEFGRATPGTGPESRGRRWIGLERRIPGGLILPSATACMATC